MTSEENALHAVLCAAGYNRLSLQRLIVKNGGAFVVPIASERFDVFTFVICRSLRPQPSARLRSAFLLI